MALPPLERLAIWQRKKDPRGRYFFLALWLAQRARWFCICTKEPGQNWGRGWDQHWFQKPFHEVPAFIEGQNKSKNVYFCPHGFKNRSRKIENAVTPTIAWADLDPIDPHDVVPLPTIAWESSPSRYSAVWVTDGPVSAELNQKLTYHTGADKGGWQLGKVLRVPGTVNYKYSGKPQGKLLWWDGPEITVAKLESLVSGKAPKGMEELPGWAERLLAKTDISSKEDRSAVLYKLVCVMKEHGYSELESFNRLKKAKWNKFHDGRRNDDDRGLRQDIERSYKKHNDKSKVSNGAGARVVDDEAEDRSFNLIDWVGVIDDVKEEKISWLWYPYVARSELTMIESDPGLSKSWVAMSLAAHLCNGIGRRLPSTFPTNLHPGAVFYCDRENTPKSIMKPRMRWLGYKDNKMFHYCKRDFSLDNPRHLDFLRRVFDKVQPILIVLDPLHKYMGDTKMGSPPAVSQVLGRYMEMAREYDIATLCIRHLSKAKHTNAVQQGSGNMSLSGEARIIMRVHLVDKSKRDQMILLPVKNNCVPWDDFKAIEYSIRKIPAELSAAKEQGNSKRGVVSFGMDENAAEFIWGNLTDDTADELIDSEADGRANSEAMKWLHGELKNGPREWSELQVEGEARSLSEPQLRRAAKRLRVKTRQEGFGAEKHAIWELPSPNLKIE